MLLIFTTTVVLNNEKYSNCMLQNKKIMLKRGIYKGPEVPYIINDLYINEHDDGYFFDITNFNDIKKIKSETEIRLTFDTWNVYRPCTQSYLEISGLYTTCDYRNMIYNCSLLPNVSVSVTLPTKLRTSLVSHIGKIRAVYCDIDEVDMFFVSYSRNEYDIVPEDQIEILFKVSDRENECRKHKVIASKILKRKFERKSHKKIIVNDGLREVDSSRTSNILTPK